MGVTVIVLAVLLAAALAGLLLDRRRLAAARARAGTAEAEAEAKASEVAAAATARAEAEAARLAAEQARIEADEARTDAERRAAIADREAAAAAELSAMADAAQREARLEADAAAAAQAEAEERLASFEQRALAAEAAHQAALADVERAERTAPTSSGDLDAQVLWALEKARTERTWRHSVAVDPTASPFTEAGVALVDAIQVELDAAREDVGAEIDLDAELPDDLTAAGAVLTLRVVQELVADLVRRAEATTLRLRPDGNDIVVTVQAVDDEDQPISPRPLPIPPNDAVEVLPDGVRIRGVTR